MRALRRSILWQLVSAFVLVALATAGFVAIFIRLSSTERLNRLIVDQERSGLVATLTEHYSTYGSWEAVLAYWQADSGLTADRTDGGFAPVPSSRRAPPSAFSLLDASGEVVLPLQPEYPLGRVVSAEVLRAGEPIVLDGEVVGTVIFSPWVPGLSRAESVYLERTTQALLGAVAVAVALALVIGWLLARAIARPLSVLTAAAQSIAAGDLEQRVPVGSEDEIGRLAGAFNRMSEEVARVNRLRRQMTADIAHDLRTPLTVIAGYVESMQEGVLEPTPERLTMIYGEIERLQRLVGDLRVLAQADSGELPMNSQLLAPRALLDRAAALFEDQARHGGITLTVEAGEALPELWGDEVRLMQVLGNLISNSLRYTASGGRIVLRATEVEGGVEISVADDGTGIPPEELPLVFERFRRADRSRHSESGESGLGLAIVRALVEAHGGTVAAESPPGRGTVVRIRLPRGRTGAATNGAPNRCPASV